MVFKKKFTVIISPTAFNDIDDATIYYALHSKKASRLFYENTFKTIDVIRKNPYYEIRFDNYRALKIHKFPFLVIFKVNEKKKEIHVITIFNTYRNPDKIELK
jgi:toxin ParE1/3/4